MIKKVVNIYNKYKSIINYIIIGGLTTIISLVTYYICVKFFLDPNNGFELQIANIISWIFAVLFAYFTNKKYVFFSSDRSITEIIKFFGCRLTTLGFDMFFMFLFVTVFDLNDKVSKILVQFIIVVLNYVFSKFFVFNKKN